MNLLLFTILVPFAMGALAFILPKNDKKLLSLVGVVISAVTCVLCFGIFGLRPESLTVAGVSLLWVDNLSAFITLFIGLFGFLIVIYSLGFAKENLNKYYAYVLWTIAASIGAVLADHMVVFLMFWGFLGITLYLLIAMGSEGAHESAKKAFIIIGASDALLVLGIALLSRLSPTLAMSGVEVLLNSQWATFAFICFALGAFAKAGAMPLHTWIPDAAENAPTPVMAFLPASLDKLLGIYLLFRVSVQMFKIQPNSFLSLFLLVIGSITIIAAVMMALVQHNFKKLLSYHAVSQVGYMVLGIGTANPIGIAGGLFHMLNNAIYKSCLFLSGGNVEHREGSDELSKLGGLAKVMPLTFITFLVASFSISGIPPLNGFVSKWMVYQGIIEMGKTGSKLWPLWLVVAMFGSALTLASFMKLIHAIFLGQPSSKAIKKTQETPPTMNIAPLVLAGLCVIFGVFALQIPIRIFIAPCFEQDLYFSGVWNASLASMLIVAGLLIGFVIYLLGTLKSRQALQFIGGEDLDSHDDMNPSGEEFYNTVKDIGFLNYMYKKAEQKWFDIYEQGKRLTLALHSFFSSLHNGVLPSYLVWVLLGMVALLMVIF